VQIHRHIALSEHDMTLENGVFRIDALACDDLISFFATYFWDSTLTAIS
jgi:hypothetical protein